MSKLIGVLGYQGGCDLYISALNKLNIKNKKILYEDDFSDLDGLIMPGGESSVQYQYCIKYQLIDKIKAFAKTGKPILGTCAGSILLSNIKSERVNGLELIDISVERNIYGSQFYSGQKTSDKGNEIVFIRAPGITNIGPNVEILDTYKNMPVYVKQSNIHCTTFHPEVMNLCRLNLIYHIFG
jgi:5'-phosphate synthase pdxT subunit